MNYQAERIKFILLCELIKEPTCLLLDEPSNDLDINSIEWLKNFIKNIDIPVIFISHDEFDQDLCKCNYSYRTTYEKEKNLNFYRKIEL